MPRAGRRRSAVWACFVENAASGKRRVFCRFCQHDLVANPIRMVRHIIKHCPHADEPHKRICREYQALTVPLRRRTGDGDGADAPALAPQPPAHDAMPAAAMGFAHFALAPAPPPSDEPDDSAHVPALDERLVERVHDELALALATTEGPALRLIENARFRKALELLGVPPMTASEIDARVVPRLSGRVEEGASEMLRVATATTLQFTAVSPGLVGLDVLACDQDHRQVSLGTLAAPSETELAALLRARIADVPGKDPCQVHVCTDAFNAPSWWASAAVRENAAPVFVTGCLMQASLSLLAAVATSTPTLRRAVDACARLGESVAADSSMRTKLQGQSDGASEIRVAQLDGSRLWSLLEVVDQATQFRHVRHDEASSELLAMVTNNRFWRDVATAQDLLRPFGFLIALSGVGHLNASVVLTSWLLVWATALRAQGLSDQEKSAIAAAVLTHIRCHASSTLVCLALDPRCRGVALSALGKRKVRAMVVATAHRLDPHGNHPALLEQVVKYLNSERPFDDEASWQMMAPLPRLFWVEYVSEAPELAAVALAALNLRPFIHSLERTWTLMSADAGGSDKQTATLKRIAFGLELMDVQASETRRQSLADAARLLVPDGSVSSSALEPWAIESGDDDPVDYASAIPSESGHPLWTRLAHVAETLRPDHATGDTVDAAWFAVDAEDAVAQLSATLHRALAGGYAVHHTTTLPHYEATEDASARHATAASATEETASEMLSGLDGL